MVQLKKTNDELERLRGITGAVDNPAIADTTEPATTISLLKGILLQMQRGGLEYSEVFVISTAEGISGGVTQALSTYPAGWTLYITAAAAIDITVALSPDGTNWFDVGDVIEIPAAGDAVVEFGFHAHSIRLTGSNAQDVTAIVRGVF